MIPTTADETKDQEKPDQTNIKFPDNRLLIDLCGEFDKNLAEIEQRLTLQIAKSIMTAIDAKGVAVTIDAAHQCMTTRSVKKEKASTVTNYFLGQFKDDLSIQNRYLRLISQ